MKKNIEILTDILNCKYIPQIFKNQEFKNTTTIEIRTYHIINALKKLKNDKQLLKWVNIIWFSDLYEYNNSESDSIASVMTHLEELDEGFQLTDSIKIKMIECLEKNISFNI